MSVGDGSGLILESDDGHSCMTEAVTTNDIHTNTLDPSQPTLANLINEKLDNIPVTNQEDIDHVIHVPDGKGEDESAFSAQKCTLLLFPQSGSKDMQLVQLVDGKLSVMAQQQTSDGSTLTTGMPSAILADAGCMPDDWNIEDSVTCKLCKLKCDSVASRKAHEKTHSASQVFRCQYCPKTFVTSYSLKSHTRVHTNERPHPCKHCEKAFKTAGDLQKHVRTHTGERPFKCPFYGCDRSFTTSNIRKVHIRTHTGEKPYRCEKEGCEKSFASATNYRNHMRIHTGEKPYVCTVLGCNRRFTEYSSLYKHQVVHTRSKPYTCEHCQKTYRQISTLTVHRRVAHNDESRVIVDTVISSEGNNEVKVESMYGVPFAIKRGDVTVSTADRPGKELARVPQNVRLLSGSTTSSSSAVSSGVASKSTVITEPAVTIQSNAIHQHLLPGDADIDRAGHQLVTSVHQVAVTNTGECTIAMAGDQAVDNTNHAASMHSEDEEGALVINTAEPASQVSELCDVIPLESQEDQLLDMNIEAATASSSTAAPDAAAALSLPSGIATTNATTAAIANEHTVTITSDTVNEQYCQIDQSDSSANVANEDAPPTVDQTQLLGTLQVHQGPDQKLYVFADPEQLKMFQELTDQDNGTYTVLPNTVDT